MLQSSTFKVGRYTCTLTTTDNRALTMRWKPDWPLFLSRDEKAEYRKRRDALLKKLDDGLNGDIAVVEGLI
jgi:hypothetical protein